ncbi:NAD(P)/FAD-dependent oxidoreductase [Geodermatophilus sp. YIM 151500]|uniref:NAD-binding protein n=1 Tax=Geodermatophilus sp. YIM 151500 TaxID=2984531 RepID=UPI0021E45A51|nr:FAD/NAD(P)-binding oxidoreductase [Geodermatophilus sp. YIM 151500]MCV2488850.1 NAD(P)/FAD-dependent oxidoreductase [Geodermatophilus sp. YIM 151500]
MVKSLTGRESEVVPCIGCQACHGGITTALGVSCVLNPATGHELEPAPEPAVRARRVLVLGSGVAGLELARVAAVRGHDVTVVTGELPFGGLLALRARVPGAAEVGDGVRWFRRTLSDRGVRVVRDAPAGEHDVTVSAVPGARHPLPAVAGSSAVVGAEDVLSGGARLDGSVDRVAVVGPGLLAGETALFLAATGRRVTLVATGERAMADAHPLVAGTTAHRLARLGARTVTGATPLAPVDGHAEPFDLVVDAMGWRPAEGPGIPVGDDWDAFAQRLLVRNATRLARTL